MSEISDDKDFIKSKLVSMVSSHAWIDAKVALPPPIDGEDYSENVLVCVFSYGEKNNCRWGYGHYNFDIGKWNYHVVGWVEQNDNDVLYWSDAPATPKLECQHKQHIVLNDGTHRCVMCDQTVDVDDTPNP